MATLPEPAFTGPMTEAEKCRAGLLYDTTYPEREAQHLACAELCYAYNHTSPSELARREALLRQILGKVGQRPYVEPNFHCSFGTNIQVGDDFFANHDCVFIDPAEIILGHHVLLGPQCGFYTAGHPLDHLLRRRQLEYARPIVVGNDVWIGGGAILLPGVTVGSNVVIGAGSVVTRDIPSGVVACGNPCRVVRDME